MTRRILFTVSAVLAAAAGTPAVAGAHGADAALRCVDPGPAYYAIELFTTKNVPGTGYLRGRADVALPRSSPFPIALAPDGSYVREIHVSLERVKPPRQGKFVAWVTTREVDRVERLGTLDAELRTSGTVRWNQFLVVITLEPEDAPEDATMWQGPIVARGMSRSGMMHTMVGHGAFQQENCAAYGYGND